MLSKNISSPGVPSPGRISMSSKRMQQLHVMNQNYTREMFGLRNLGNTCFLNSILQCLVSVPPLALYFKEKFSPSDICSGASTGARSLNGTGGQLAQEFKAFMDEALAASGGQCLNPAAVRQVMIKFAPQFSGYNQQDAHEAMRFLLDGLHEDLNRVRIKPKYVELQDKKGESLDEAAMRWWSYSMSTGNSVITDIFGGQLFNETYCHICGHASWAFDTFLDLSLPVPTNRVSSIRDITLTDCLREFTDREKLDVEDYKCENCKRTQHISKRMGIYKPPQVLVIHLKRFSWMSRRKLDVNVHFPLRGLDIGEFVEANPTVGSRVGSVFDIGNVENEDGMLMDSTMSPVGKYKNDNNLDRGISGTSWKNVGRSSVVPTQSLSAFIGGGTSEEDEQRESERQSASRMSMGPPRRRGRSNSNRYIYDLVGVSQHAGSMSGGHYTACVRLGCVRNENWANISDSTAIPTRQSEDTSSDSSAYVLFYVRR
ncbi:unnamed protein product [Amoebophrya sp. A25]|nr:unnamed protein product [Amoebophrya sp. A25]|eukprot:GSA25T00019410001.1